MKKSVNQLKKFSKRRSKKSIRKKSYKKSQKKMRGGNPNPIYINKFDYYLTLSDEYENYKKTENNQLKGYVFFNDYIPNDGTSKYTLIIARNLRDALIKHQDFNHFYKFLGDNDKDIIKSIDSIILSLKEDEENVEKIIYHNYSNLLFFIIKDIQDISNINTELYKKEIEEYKKNQEIKNKRRKEIDNRVIQKIKEKNIKRRRDDEDDDDENMDDDDLNKRMRML